MVATPARLPGRRGGTLVTRSLFQPRGWDTIDARAWSDVHTVSPMFNHLIFVDPYGDGKALVGDAAAGWTWSADGTVLTVTLNRGIEFHDGIPMTSKDVLYNLERAWKSTTASGSYFKTRFSPISGLEAPDDSTVRISLEEPSNFFLQALSLIPFQIYPAHMSFPDNFDAWKENPIGTGPFAFEAINPGVDMIFTRNANYFKEGLPYLDGVRIVQMNSEAAVAAFRAGQLDASNLDTGAISGVIDSLVASTGFVYRPIRSGLYGAYFNQRAPWTDKSVRKAIDIAMDRESVNLAWLRGIGSIYTIPMMPPELGGAWGLSIEELKGKPGFRPEERDKDLAAAKGLLSLAGVIPSEHTVNLVGSRQLTTAMEAAEQTFRDLGFKTRIDPLETAELADRQAKGDYDIWLPSTGTIQVDDPLDILCNWFCSEGPWNYANWTNAELDALFIQQDRELDPGKRATLIDQIQRMILDLRWNVGIVWRQAYVGHQPWVKNFPLQLNFQFQQKFRHEQVWIDEGLRP
jgi:peptide/nickel transport system substrate-binding protein